MSNKIKKSSFLWYYRNNPEFREKHKKYMAELIQCKCGCYVHRSSMYKHKNSEKHKKLTVIKPKPEYKYLLAEINKLKEQIKQQ
jgi:hypothetical protein